MLYFPLASSTFLFLFFKISFATSIQLPTSLFKDYSIRIDIALEALTAVNTDSKIASCSSPTDGAQIMSNDVLFRTSAFS